LTLVLALGYALQAIVLALLVYAALRLTVRSYWLWQGVDSVHQAKWSARFPAAQLAYSLPLAATTCVGMVGGMLDRAIVAVSFTPVDYAIYSVGALEIPLDTIFQSSVLNVLRASLPGLVMDGRLDEVIRIWRDSVRKLALVVIPSFVFLVMFAERFITTLFTHQYQASVHVFRIYLLLVPLHMLVLSVIPQVYGKTRLNLYVVATAVACNAVLSLALLRAIGILGPATAFVCSSYLASVLYFIVTMRLLKARATQLLPLVGIGRTLVASGLATIPALAVAALPQSGLLSLAIAGATFAAAYVLFGFLLRVFHASDIRTARSWLRRIVPAVGG